MASAMARVVLSITPKRRKISLQNLESHYVDAKTFGSPAHLPRSFGVDTV